MIIKYKKIINFLDNASNKPTNISTKHWVNINDGTRGTYSTTSQIRFKKLMLKSSYVIILMHIYL